ncbi:MAG TPA: DUF2249 domain-containing protein [Ruania sp.]|nr:DUF2249 domain-containing protein [Ruania sp.]
MTESQPLPAGAEELPVTDVSSSGCGCGCTDEGVPVLDVREIPHAIRHATVFGALGAVPTGGSLDLIAPHDPKPLLAQIADRDPVQVTYLQSGPQAWTLRLTRQG